MFGSDLGIILLYAAAIMLIFMILWVLIVPFKLLNKVIINALLGFICIFFYNIAAHYADFNAIGVNALTGAIVSTLGVPGFLAIVIIKNII